MKQLCHHCFQRGRCVSPMGCLADEDERDQRRRLEMLGYWLTVAMAVGCMVLFVMWPRSS